MKKKLLLKNEKYTIIKHDGNLIENLIHNYKNISEEDFRTILGLNKIVKRNAYLKLLIDVGVFNNLSHYQITSFIENEDDFVAFYGINNVQLLEYKKAFRRVKHYGEVKFFRSREYAINWLLKANLS